MPKIPSEHLDCVFYLYRDRESALTGEGFGGTGFFVGMPVPAKPQNSFVYAVTNWHVAVKDGFSVIRLNTRAGPPDIFEFGPEDWLFMPNADDLAICPMSGLNSERHRIVVIGTPSFVTREDLAPQGIGVGEDLYMVGRFVDHDGGETNQPAARFGNISVMPTAVQHPTGAVRETFLIDMHSRTGYSGSPVFVYRTPGGDLETTARKRIVGLGPGFLKLLGIHFGQFPEEWEIKEKKKDKAEVNSVLVEGNVVDGLSGMTLVIPAYRLAELLDDPRVKIPRDMENVRLSRGAAAKPRAESADDVAKRRDEMLRSMHSAATQPGHWPTPVDAEGG